MKKIELRPYQIRVLNKLWAAMQKKKDILCCLPCSAGKTIIFSKIIQRLLRENENFRCLVLVDREILVTQSRDKLIMVAPELAQHIGISCASVDSKKDTTKKVTIASRQTLINQLDNLKRMYQLTICDEAHLIPLSENEENPGSQYGEILKALWERNPNMRLFGCTASPYRLGTKGGYIYGATNSPDVIPYFDKIDAHVSNAEMIESGYIVPLKGFARVSQQIESDLSNVGKIAGEYNLKQLTEVMCKELHITACVTAYKEFAQDRKKTVVFCTTIEHSEQVAKALNQAGISALSIHSKLPVQEVKNRMHQLASCNPDSVKVFTSVAKLTTGMDINIIDCIMLARPTQSTALFQQIIGRGQRLAPDKKDCLILDLVGNVRRFGMDMDSLFVQIPKGAGNGEAPTKICPGDSEMGTICGAQIHAAALVCPKCGYKFPKEETQDRLGLMEEVKFKNGNNLDPPKWYDIDYMDCEIWVSAVGKHLLKITLYFATENYYIRDYGVSVWCCFEDYYTGYAVEKGQEKWELFSDEPYPANVFEAEDLMQSLKQPTRVECQRKEEDGFLEAKSFEFKDETVFI